mgnify:CR=1 FL=1
MHPTVIGIFPPFSDNISFSFRFIAGLSFYGLNFNLGNLTGSVYINTLIYGVSELSVSILIAFSHQTGRRVPAIICFLIGGVTLILSAILSVLLNQESKLPFWELAGGAVQFVEVEPILFNSNVHEFWPSKRGQLPIMYLQTCLYKNRSPT